MSLAARPSLLPTVTGALASSARSISVVVDNNNLDKAMRTLKRKMIESGVLRELKQRSVFMKPSQERVRS